MSADIRGAGSSPAPRTRFDKVWDAHVVEQESRDAVNAAHQGVAVVANPLGP